MENEEKTISNRYTKEEDDELFGFLKGWNTVKLWESSLHDFRREVWVPKFGPYRTRNALYMHAQKLYRKYHEVLPHIKFMDEGMRKYPSYDHKESAAIKAFLDEKYNEGGEGAYISRAVFTDFYTNVFQEVSVYNRSLHAVWFQTKTWAYGKLKFQRIPAAKEDARRGKTKSASISYSPEEEEALKQLSVFCNSMTIKQREIWYQKTTGIFRTWSAIRTQMYKRLKIRLTKSGNSPAPKAPTPEPTATEKPKIIVKHRSLFDEIEKNILDLKENFNRLRQQCEAKQAISPKVMELATMIQMKFDI